MPILRRVHPLSAVFLLFGLAILTVNPLRETALLDDWAYALTVKGLIETGRYAPHEWLAANMPFQAVWGALFAMVLGYSHTTLRISTLVLAAVGLASFYGLAREHDLDEEQAGLLTLILMASPLMLGFSFTFMTDVPFVSLCLLAMWGYTRAIRAIEETASAAKQIEPQRRRGAEGKNSKALMWMVGASLAAGAAVLTRQFGVALVAGLGVVWLRDSHRWRRVPFYMVGVIVPLVAVAWQLYAGSVDANWTAEALTNDQAAYLRSGRAGFEVFWRTVVIFEYMALFGLPLGIGGIRQFVQEARQHDDMHDPKARWALAVVAIPATLMMAMRVIGTLVYMRRGTLPLILWNLDVIATWPEWASAALTAICLIGAVLIMRDVIMRYLGERLNRVDRHIALPLHSTVLDGVTLFFFVMQLVFVQFGDEYLLPLLPYVLIVVGRTALPGASVRARWAMVACAVVLLTISALWTRELLDRSEAMWTASEALREQGVDPKQIATLWEWEAYHGSFDRYLARLPKGEIGRLGDYLNEYFNVFRAQEQIEACYLISMERPREAWWRKVGEMTYQRCE